MLHVPPAQLAACRRKLTTQLTKINRRSETAEEARLRLAGMDVAVRLEVRPREVRRFRAQVTAIHNGRGYSESIGSSERCLEEALAFAIADMLANLTRTIAYHRIQKAFELGGSDGVDVDDLDN